MAVLLPRRARALVAVLPLTLAGAVAACEPTALPAAVLPPCPTDQLHITTQPMGAATGQRYDAVSFTNTGTAVCTLAGTPGFAPVDDAGEPVGTPAGPDPASPDPAPLVTLEPGAAAHAVVTSVSPWMFPDEACGAVVPAVAAEVSVAGSGAPARVAFPLERCTTGVAGLTIGTVAAGAPALGG